MTQHDRWNNEMTLQERKGQWNDTGNITFLLLTDVKWQFFPWRTLARISYPFFVKWHIKKEGAIKLHLLAFVEIGTYRCPTYDIDFVLGSYIFKKRRTSPVRRKI